MNKDLFHANTEARSIQNRSLSPDGELHLIVLCEKARKVEERIIEDAQQSLQLLQVYDMGWSTDSFSSNMSRFYGVKLGGISGTVSDVGKGRFLLIIL